MVDLLKLVLILLIVGARLAFGVGATSSPIVLDPGYSDEALYFWRNVDCGLKDDVLRIRLKRREKGDGELSITLEDFEERLENEFEIGLLTVKELNQELRWLEKFPVVFKDRDNETRALVPKRHPKAGCTFNIFDEKYTDRDELKSFRLALSCEFLVGLNKESWGHRRKITISKKNAIFCKFPTIN